MHLKNITNQQNTTKEPTACSTAAVMTKEGQLLAVSAATQGGARDVRKHSLLGNGCLPEVSSSSVISPHHNHFYQVHEFLLPSEGLFNTRPTCSYKNSPQI